MIQSAIASLDCALRKIALRSPHVLICRNTAQRLIAALLEDSGKTSFSKLKRRFSFEEEVQRNE